MGYYIEVPKNHNKAQQLVDLYKAERLPVAPNSINDVPEGKAVVVVVENLAFDAAGYCYDDRELADFKEPDHGWQRPRTWLLMDKKLTEKLSGYR